MAVIEFSTEEKAIICAKIQRYFQAELDQELGQFDAEFLLDFFAAEVGAFFYNRGLHDALAVVESRMADLGDALYDIEQPTNPGL